MSTHALMIHEIEDRACLAVSSGVFGIYESPRELARMHCLYRELAAESRRDLSVHCDWFDFRELSNRHLEQRARRAAANADLLLLSVNSRAEPKPSHRKWLERCLPEEEMCQATVEVPLNPDGCSNQPRRPLRAYLRETTPRAGADFLSRLAALDSPGTSWPWLLLRPNSRSGILVQFIPADRCSESELEPGFPP